ncbi:unnamed protein product [Durusdinium trenchii]|uniref:RanBP2-type domain-containing protein n=1 Tax=Durusdinium trenchii TaxID=1381693 RepID=A0ABP0PZ64_9DINO
MGSERSVGETGESTGLSLFLDIAGRRECISVRSNDLGRKVWSDLRTLSAVHRIKLDGFECRRPDGNLLNLDQELSAQGLREGSTLAIREAARSRKHETVIVDKEELHAGQAEAAEVKSGIEPHLWRREDREAKAKEIKQKANETLKEGSYAEARELYSAALAWLPPDDSDVDLVAALFGNRALAHMKLERWEDAKADAGKSLELVPGNCKVQYRLGMAYKALNDFVASEQCFRAMLEKDPEDRAAKNALASVQASHASALNASKTCDATPKPKPTPKGLTWRLALWQQGYTLPRLQHVWRDLHSGTSASSEALPTDLAACLGHAWRHQEPLTDFFLSAILDLKRNSPTPLCITVLGTGSMSAVKACSKVSSGAADGLSRITILEPSGFLVTSAQKLTSGQHQVSLDFVQAAGQLDTEFAFDTKTSPFIPKDCGDTTCLLLCDRISEDLVGERLITTMKAGRDAAFAAVQKTKSSESKVLCLPAKAELVCAPLELRCVECAGFDTSKANALRFTAHSREEPPTCWRVWKCEVCSWRNVSQVKACELCRAVRRQTSGMEQKRSRKQDSSGWWPVDLDTESKNADVNGVICRFAGQVQVVCSFDFNETIFQEQQRMMQKDFEAEALQNGHVNAMCVWWRLYSTDGSFLDTGPTLAACNSNVWPTKRQAVFYLGYEVGVEKGEALRFRIHFGDSLSRIHFEMLEPRVVDRMGLMKFEVEIVNERVLEELQSKLDMKSNRLTASVHGTPLKRRDKLLSFGPFDLVPGTMTDELWRKVKDRLERHSQRPKRGDEPIRCVFQHGVFEGTRRWPWPTLADHAVVPRQPSFFEHFGQLSIGPYLELLKSGIEDFALSDPNRRVRVLELNCGPVALLSLWAASHGARVWAVEAIPDLRELAQETVRDHGLEMVFKQKGLADFRFFGGSRMPGEPSVRVQNPALSTAMEVGHPKFLDGARADIIVCRPESGGPLGLDFLETMRHAFEELLEPGGEASSISFGSWSHRSGMDALGRRFCGSHLLPTANPGCKT